MTDDDDANLVALIDGRLEGAAREALTARLDANPGLRARFERLAAGGLPFGTAFEAVLNEAPVARMQARFDAIADADPTSARWPIRQIWGSAVAAGLALFVVGWAIGRYVPIGPGLPPSLIASNPEQDDWRQAVAEYLALDGADTLAPVPSGEGALSLLSDRLGLKLDAGSIALPGMTFKRALMLSYDGAPLGQVAYLDDAGRPAAFCVIRDGQADAPIAADQHEGLSLASWARSGRGYVVVGRFSQEHAKELGQLLAARF